MKKDNANRSASGKCPKGAAKAINAALPGGTRDPPTRRDCVSRVRVAGEEVRTDALIRELVARTCRDATQFDTLPCHPEYTAAEDVLLDTEVDGVRCILLRSALSTNHKPSLSPREMEIARMVAKGYANKTIAAVLEISIWTVSTHLRRVFAKFAVTSRAAMVARMMETGLMKELSDLFKEDYLHNNSKNTPGSKPVQPV